MAKNNAECGKRDERELVKDLKARGYDARRQPGSGNVDPTLPHDVVWADSPIGKLLIECKWRASCGWKTLLNWMEGAPILTLSCDKRRGQDGERYVFMRWDTFMALVGDAAHRAEPADFQVEPDKPWLRETESWERKAITEIMSDMATESERRLKPETPAADSIMEQIEEVNRRRERLAAAYHVPEPRKPKTYKLKGGKFNA